MDFGPHSLQEANICECSFAPLPNPYIWYSFQVDKHLCIPYFSSACTHYVIILEHILMGLTVTIMWIVWVISISLAPVV
jgi:hypothetical protein